MESALFDELNKASLSAFQQLAAKYGDEEIYSVALFTSPEYRWLNDTIATKVGLRTVAEEYLSKPRYQDSSLDAMMLELKWNPCDSPYHLECETLFEASDSILHDIWMSVDYDNDSQVRATWSMVDRTAIAVMKNIRDSGLFNSDDVVFNLLKGDQSNEEQLRNAAKLNRPDLVARYGEEMAAGDRLFLSRMKHS